MKAVIDVTGTVLKTLRLTLRPFEQSDLQDFYAYARVDGVGQMAGWIPHRNIEETQVILNHFLKDRNNFAVVENGRTIGSIGLNPYSAEYFPQYDSLRVTDIGYVLAKDRWGNGLMPEAAGAVLKWVFEEKKIDVVICGNFVSNPQSGRVKEKLGFHDVLMHPMHTRAGRDEICREGILTKEEWFRRYTENGDFDGRKEQDQSPASGGSDEGKAADHCPGHVPYKDAG